MMTLVQHVVALSPYNGEIWEPFNGFTMKMTYKTTLFRVFFSWTPFSSWKINCCLLKMWTRTKSGYFCRMTLNWSMVLIIGNTKITTCLFYSMASHLPIKKFTQTHVRPCYTSFRPTMDTYCPMFIFSFCDG